LKGSDVCSCISLMKDSLAVINAFNKYILRVSENDFQINNDGNDSVQYSRKACIVYLQTYTASSIAKEIITLSIRRKVKTLRYMVKYLLK
jgi:hypothetical protein